MSALSTDLCSAGFVKLCYNHFFFFSVWLIMMYYDIIIFMINLPTKFVLFLIFWCIFCYKCWLCGGKRWCFSLKMSGPICPKLSNVYCIWCKLLLTCSYWKFKMTKIIKSNYSLKENFNLFTLILINLNLISLVFISLILISLILITLIWKNKCIKHFHMGCVEDKLWLRLVKSSSKQTINIRLWIIKVINIKVIKIEIIKSHLEHDLQANYLY